MELNKASDKYYRVGTTREQSEFSKIAKISIVALVCSFFLVLVNALDIYAVVQSNVLLFIFLLALIVFVLALMLSILMIFLSKQRSPNVFLSLLCYLFIVGFVVMAIITVISGIVSIASIISLSNGQITEDTILQIVSGLRGYIITLVVLGVLVELSMLISFKLKNLKNNAVNIFLLVTYLVGVAVKPLLGITAQSTTGFFALISLDVFCLVCLYLLLEVKTREVSCLVYVNEKGEELYVDKPVDKTINLVRRARIRLALEISAVALSIFIAVSSFIGDSSGKGVMLIPGIITIAFTGFAIFYFAKRGVLNRLNVYGMVSLIVGLEIMLFSIVYIKQMDDILITVVSIISFIAITFGGTLYFFLKKVSDMRLQVLKLILFVILCIAIGYCFASLFFSPDIKEHFSVALPIMSSLITLLFARTYFIYKYDD